MSEVQNYGNHTRWHPPFHFVLAPLMLANLIYAIVRFVQMPGWDRGEFVILSVALVMLTLLTRLYAVRNQDRVVRLEERIRYERVLPPELAARTGDLSISDVIALRFADDSELEVLMTKTLNGEFAKQKDIKMAVTKWRADLQRV